MLHCTSMQNHLETSAAEIGPGTVSHNNCWVLCLKVFTESGICRKNYNLDQCPFGLTDCESNQDLIKFISIEKLLLKPFPDKKIQWRDKRESLNQSEIGIRSAILSFLPVTKRLDKQIHFKSVQGVRNWKKSYYLTRLRWKKSHLIGLFRVRIIWL